MNDVGRYAEIDGIGVVTIDSPPVNAVSVAVRRAIADGIGRAIDDPGVRGIVLACDGRTFFAGADITEFGKPLRSPDFPAIIDLLDGSNKPIVAAIHGTALGGGFEIALACHYRVAATTAKVGLPEVALGLLPGAGGTQRLPRLIGVEKALEIIVGGKPVGAAHALKLGMVDAVVDADRLREEAIAFAKARAQEGGPLPRARDKDEALTEARGSDVFERFTSGNARAFRGFKAPGHIVKAVQAAVDGTNFETGLAREGELFAELLASRESAAQRHVFFAEREAVKVPDVPASTPTLPIRTAGVIGAGTMGGGIAMNFLNAGIGVTLVETNQAALDRGLSVIRRNYEATAAKGRMTTEQVEARMGLIRPSLEMEALADVDLVIEAVFEQMAIKQQIFGQLDRICKQGAILATNTSYLDVDGIAAATGRPEHVCGLHFFSPANVMPLLEVVRGARTDATVIATAMKLARTLGKKPVLSRVGHGFIANRVMEPYMTQAMALIAQGPTPTDVDQAMVDYGFAMGPLAMLDLVGLDVIGRDNPTRTIMGDLVAMERLGQKKNGGFFDYDAKRRPTPSPAAAEAIAKFAADTGAHAIGPQTADEIVKRLLYPVVNEGAKVLDEGIASRASDIDLACILGYNWPIYTGGPMFWAEAIGLPRIVATLKEWQGHYGDAFAPAPLLERLAAEGGSFADVGQAKAAAS